MSRRRPKTSLVNLLRDKKVAIAAAVCVVVAVGAYVGVNMFSSHAAPDLGQQRGIINDINDIKGKKSGGNRKIGIGQGQLGSETNPFVILEISRISSMVISPRFSFSSSSFISGVGSRPSIFIVPAS